MFETCNNDYESPPEGVPTWCVQLDTGWETWAQLIVEILLLALLYLSVRQFKLWIYSRRRRLPSTEPLPLVSISGVPPEERPIDYVPHIVHTS